MDGLNSFSFSVYNELISRFSNLKGSFQANSELLQVEYTSPYNSEMGGLIVQITEDDTIWLRIYPGCSAYSVDSLDELEAIIKGVLKDEVYWTISFKNDNWVGTTLSKDLNDLELEDGTTYHIYSWSGKYDKEISM